MNDEQRIVYTQGILLQARIELEARLAANAERARRGESLAYNEEQLRILINAYGIYHNVLILNLTGYCSEG